MLYKKYLLTYSVSLLKYFFQIDYLPAKKAFNLGERLYMIRKVYSCISSGSKSKFHFQVWARVKDIIFSEIENTITVVSSTSLKAHAIAFKLVYKRI